MIIEPSLLEALPNELLDAIFSRLPANEQGRVALSSRRLNALITPHLYHSIELVDRHKEATGDEHDDTPIIRMLLLFAQSPSLASHVRELLHRCHLHLPDVWQDLPHMSFKSPTISQSRGLQCLLQRAIRNLCNVHTLRIVFGHHPIVIGLLSGFFSKSRPVERSLRRLWLESCCLEGLPWDGGSVLPQSQGLESFRYRRSNASFENYTETFNGTFRYRYGLSRSLVDERADRDEWGTYAENTAFTLWHDSERVPVPASWDIDLVQEFPILQHSADVTASFCTTCPPSQPSLAVATITPVSSIDLLLQQASSTLTSLTLDWVLDGSMLVSTLAAANLFFPGLRALQVRNAVETLASIPPGDPFTLLSGPWLDFLCKHPNIECLAWPMDRILPYHEQQLRGKEVQTVIAQLGRTLKALRVDTRLNQAGEPQTSDSGSRRYIEASRRRRSFIEHVASQMSALKSIKVEGGVPYDERHELLRALRDCALQKVVIIGISWAVNDTWRTLPHDVARSMKTDEWDIEQPMFWDSNPVDLAPSGSSIEYSSSRYRKKIESDRRLELLKGYLEDGHTNQEFYDEEVSRIKTASEKNSRLPPFAPSYGSPVPDILQTLSVTQASTITELKFCGFYGALVLHNPIPGTPQLLQPLRCFHNLEYLTTAVWIPTFFDHQHRGLELGAYWENRVSLPHPDADLLPGNWAHVLEPQFKPSILAQRVAALIGPHLSRKAIARKAGVTVKALILAQGIWVNYLYEMEVVIGKDREVVSFVGPRGEENKERLKEKMLSRGWF